MMQCEIIDSLPGELDDLAKAVNAMESRGLIQRKWQANQGTYIVPGKQT